MFEFWAEFWPTFQGLIACLLLAISLATLFVGVQLLVAALRTLYAPPPRRRPRHCGTHPGRRP